MIEPPFKKKLIKFKVVIDLTFDSGRPGEGPQTTHHVFTRWSEIVERIKNTAPELSDFYDSLTEKIEISEQAK